MHPVAYASRFLSAAVRNYSVTELETLEVVWVLPRFHLYLYRHSVTILMSHATVRAVLETPSSSCEHACWWTKVYGTGLEDVKIVYQAGHLNASAGALFRSPQSEVPVCGEAQVEMHIAGVQSEATCESSSETQNADGIVDLLPRPAVQVQNDDFATEQWKDQINNLLEHGKLPVDGWRAQQIALQKPMFTIKSGMLFYLDSKQDHHK